MKNRKKRIITVMMNIRLLPHCRVRKIITSLAIICLSRRRSTVTRWILLRASASSWIRTPRHSRAISAWRSMRAVSTKMRRLRVVCLFRKTFRILTRITRFCSPSTTQRWISKGSQKGLLLSRRSNSPPRPNLTKAFRILKQRKKTLL